MTRPALVFVYPGDLDTRTGGYRYDKRIIADIQKTIPPWHVELVSLPGDYPFPDKVHQAAADTILASLAEGALVVIDGLAYSVLPDIVARHARRLNLVALIHHPLALETGLGDEQSRHLKALETRALQHACRVVTTSALTAESLAEYEVAAERITAVLPGTDLSNVAQGSQTSQMNLLCVGTLTPRKGHTILLEALADLRHLPWHLNCAGATDRDEPTYTALLAQREQLDLVERVSFVGELDDSQLDDCYHNADVFVLASFHEGYGMVLSEAIARGLPIVCTDGGAMIHTVPDGAGLLVPTGDTQALRHALDQFMKTASLRADMRTAALRARQKLRSWPQAAAEFATVLNAVQPASRVS